MPIHVDPSREALSGLPEPGEVLAGKYRLVRLIGVGGMGAVLEGLHIALGERVAVKFLLPSLVQNEEALERFEREAKALVLVKSEHVARVFDVATDAAGRPYMVMEYLEGRDLGQIISTNARLEVREAVGHLLQSFEAVAEAHSLGIIHRDLKPENLYLIRRRDGSSCVKVLDFGLSKMIRLVASQGQRPRALTMDDKTLGTPNYMSPEQWMSAKDVGPAADQWALAAILYEVLAGRPAFGGKHVGEVCGRILNLEPVPLRSLRPDVPEGVAAAVHRALNKDPGRRFPTLVEFAAALECFGPPHADLSVQRIAGVLQRPLGGQIPTLLGMASSSDLPTTVRKDEAEADTLLKAERPAEAADRWGSTPSWQAAARPLEAARRRKVRNLIAAAAAVGLGAVIALGLALGGGSDDALEAGTTGAEARASAQPPAVGADGVTLDAAGPDPTQRDAGDGPRSDPPRPNASSSAAASSSTGAKRPPTGTPRPKSTSIFDQRW